MMMGPTWSCSCRQHRWGCSGSQEQDPLLRFAWHSGIVYVYVYVLPGGIIIRIWMAMMTRLMRSTLFECEKHNFVSIAFHACRPGQELVHVFGPGEHNWTALYNMYVFFVLQSISKSNCQLFNMNTWNSRSQFSNLKVEYLEIFLGLLPPAARLLLPPVAKMMTEFL